MDSAAQYDIGDLVFATEAMFNDGHIPEIADDALLTAPGGKGVVVMFGYAEADPQQEIYLVRFEGEDGILGPPVGCLPEELTQDELLAGQVLASWLAAQPSC